MYFAKLEDKGELLTALERSAEDFYNYLNSSCRVHWAKKALQEYYIAKFDSQQLRKDKQGRMRINVAELQNFVQYTMSLLANQPSSFDPMAVNSDSKSQYQVKVSRNILDYYNESIDLNTNFKEALEMAIVTTESFMSLSWDRFSGEEYMSDEDGKMYHEGDITLDIHDLTDVVRDVTNRKRKDNYWYILRRQINKYELAARYPDEEEYILNLGSEIEENKELNFDSQSKSIESDMVYYYEFRHRRVSLLCPNGRQTIYIPGRILEDNDLPYNDILIFKLAPKKEMRSNFSWSNTYDLVGFQQALSKFYSIILTNLAAFGYQNVVSTRGSNISVSELAKGLRHFEVNPGTEISGLNLTNIPREVFEAIGTFEKKSEGIEGLNSVIKGQPEASLKSGAALALVASQAISFLSGLDESYTKLQQDVATGIIDILKIYANTPRMVAISGKSNASLITTKFTKDTIADISRVLVKRSNPLSKTISGRINLAEMMMEKQQITPAEYLNVINTGQIESEIEGPTAEITLVKSENERLRAGEAVPVIEFDDHPFHVQEHKTLLSDPVLRYEPELVRVVLDHITQHKQFGPPQSAIPSQAHKGLPMAMPPMPELNAQGGEPVGPPLPTDQLELVNQPSMPTLPEGTPPELVESYAKLTGER